MLHTTFHGNRSTGSGEVDFLGFLPFCSRRSSWYCYPDDTTKRALPLPVGAPNKSLIGQAVLEKIYEDCYLLLDDGRATDIALPGEPEAQTMQY